MKRILKSIFLPENDKLLHVIAGIYIFLFSNLIVDNYQSLLIAIAFAIGKELLWDKKLKKGTPDVADAVYTAMGAISVFALTL